MIIAHINLQRGLNGKATHLEAFCDNEQIDIIGVTECDSSVEAIPMIEGYELFTQKGCYLQRLIVYARKGTKISQIELSTEAPSLALELGS